MCDKELQLTLCIIRCAQVFIHAFPYSIFFFAYPAIKKLSNASLYWYWVHWNR